MGVLQRNLPAAATPNYCCRTAVICFMLCLFGPLCLKNIRTSLVQQVWRQRPSCCGNSNSSAPPLASQQQHGGDWNTWALLEQRRLQEPARHRLRMSARLDPGPMPAAVAYRPAPGQADVSHIRVFGDGLGARVQAPYLLAGHLFAPADVPQALPRPDQLLPCRVGHACTFHILALDPAGQPATQAAARELVFRARLFGDVLIPVGVAFNASTGLHDARYTAHDPGQFIAEVKLAWISQAGAAGPAHAYDQQQPPTPFGEVIFRSSHLLEVVAAAPASGGGSEAAATTPAGKHRLGGPSSPTAAAAGVGATTPLCGPAVTAAPGRWVYVPLPPQSAAAAGGQQGCHPPFCSGSSLQAVEVADRLGLNQGFVWAPHGCHLRLYSTSDLAACAQGCSYKTWSFFGDSVGREQLQNLELLATGFRPSFAMPKLKADSASRSIPLLPSNITLDVLWQRGGGDVQLLQLADPHFLMDHPLLDAAAHASYRQKLAAFAASCRGSTAGSARQHNSSSSSSSSSSSTPACVYLAPSAVQREVDWARGTWAGPPAALKAITHPRMQTLRAWGISAAGELGLTVLDGGAITEAHWWSSWDGLHYSEMDTHFPGGGSTWSGGASAMILQVLLNHLCNRPCNLGAVS